MAVTTNLGLTLLGADRRQPEVIIDANMQLLDAAATGGPFGCRVYNNANISLTNATVTALTFNSEIRDDGTMHSTSSNTDRITVPTGGAGWYIVGGSARFASNATGLRQISIELNATTTIVVRNQAAISGNETALAVSIVRYFAVADYVKLLAFQNSGGALNIDYVSEYSPFFFMKRI